MQRYSQRSFLYPHLFKLICISLIFFSSLANAENINGKSGQANNKWNSDWEDERTEKGVSAQCRTHITNIKQCRFTTESDLPIASLSAVIMDVNRFKEWAVSVIESDQIVYDENDQDTYVYTVYHFTGAYNRDALTRYRRTDFPGVNRTKIDFITVNKPVEKKDLRLVRFPLMAGYWQFTKKENGKTEIELLTFSLPGGIVQNVLYSLFNVGSLDASFETMQTIQKQASLPEYLAKATK
tara:strand:+ start:11644 stop:12360 length:717 start_codon:yes stop_codon:yes gene_type:complete